MQYPDSKFNLMQSHPMMDGSRGLFGVNDMSALLSNTQPQLAFGLPQQHLLFSPQSASSFVYPQFANTLAAQTLGMFPVASMPTSSPQLTLHPAKSAPSFLGQTIEFSVYVKTSNRHWGPRYIRSYLDSQTSRHVLNQLLFQTVALDNCSSATLNGNALSGQTTVISALMSLSPEAVSAAVVTPVTPASSNSSSASLHESPAEAQSSASPLQLHFTLPDTVKPCTCIGCPNLFSKIASRRSCDICHEEGHLVEPPRVVLIKFPPSLPIKLIKTSTSVLRAITFASKRAQPPQNSEAPTPSPSSSAASSDPTPQPSDPESPSSGTAAEGAELLAMLGRYSHWKFEALPPASEGRKKRKEGASESKEVQELFLVFASSSVAREFIAEVSGVPNATVSRRDGYDTILLGSGGISIQTLSADTYTRIKMRNLSHFWRLEVQVKGADGKTKELLFTKIGKQNQNRDRKARSQPPSPRDSNSGTDSAGAPSGPPSKPRSRANSTGASNRRTKATAAPAPAKARQSKAPSSFRSKAKADTSSVGSSDSDVKAMSAVSSGSSQPATPFNPAFPSVARPALPLPLPMQQQPLFQPSLLGLPPLSGSTVPTFPSYPLAASAAAPTSLPVPAMQAPNALDFSLNVQGIDVPASQLLQFLLTRASQPTLPTASPSLIASPFSGMTASSLAGAPGFPLQRGLATPLASPAVSVAPLVHSAAPPQAPAPSSSSAFLLSRAANAQSSAFAPVAADSPHATNKRTATQSAESGLSPTTVATNATDSPSGSVASGSSLSTTRSQKRRAVPAISTQNSSVGLVPDRVPAGQQEAESPLTGNSATASDHARALLSLAASSSSASGSRLLPPQHRRDESAMSIASSVSSVQHHGSAHRRQPGDAVRSNRTPGQPKPRKTRREPGHWVLTVTEAPLTTTVAPPAERQQVEGGVDLGKLEEKNRWLFFSRFSYHPLLLLMELIIAGFCLFLIVHTLSVNSTNDHQQNHNMYLSQAHKALVDSSPNWSDPNFLDSQASGSTGGTAASSSSEYPWNEEGTTASNTLYSENQDHSWSLVRPFHNVERVQESVNVMDENAKDILTAIRGVSWVFRTFLRCFNVSNESLSFRETRTRLGLLQRGVEALRSGEGLSDLLDGFIDLNGNFTALGGFQAWAGSTCTLLNNPVTLSVMVSTCSQVDFVSRPLPPALEQSVGALNPSLACPNISSDYEYQYPADYTERRALSPFAARRRVNRRLVRLASAQSSSSSGARLRTLDSDDDWEDDTDQDEHQDDTPANDAFAAAEALYLGSALGFYNSSDRCAAGVALLLKRFSFSKHDDSSYSPPQPVILQRIRSWAEQLRLESSGLHVPLAMLSMLDRQGPRGVLVDTRDWEVNGTLLIALSFGAYGCHMLLTLCAASAASAWNKSESVRVAIMSYVRGRKIHSSDEPLPPAKHETGLENFIITPTPGQPPSETHDAFDTGTEQDDMSDSGDFSGDHTPLPARPSSSVQMSSLVARRESSGDRICV